MEVGTKFEVVKGGSLDLGGSKLRLNVGEIWDIVDSGEGFTDFRKLNQRGGSTCVLNGKWVASVALRQGKVREMTPDEPKAVAHDELRKRTGAR